MRVDASHLAGAGHVMRCLTLADALRETGMATRFVCREHPGNLISFIQGRGYPVDSLPAAPAPAHTLTISAGSEDPYQLWLGVCWEDDASQTRSAIEASGIPAWLVVDHYAIDERWERALRSAIGRLLVIDDLANRHHDADILVDQTVGRLASDYQALVNPGCELRCGVENVLLRTEFDRWRERSLARREAPALRRILVSLGGVDRDNTSRDVLLLLDECVLPPDVEICVILGASSPWVSDIRELAQRLRNRTELKVAVTDMAAHLATADLVIGAAGTSAWERCCLGVPTLMLMLADNQKDIAARLSSMGAARLLPAGPAFRASLVQAVRELLEDPRLLREMSDRAAALVPGSGAGRLARIMAGSRE